MQLSSWTAATSLVLVAFAKSALACDGYLNCHCYNSDGKPNDAATETVCKRYAAGNAQMIVPSDWSDGAKECQYIGKEGERRGKAWHPFGFSNCQWRDMCGEAGATGADSSCRDHAPVGGKSYKAGAIYVKHN
ncbi:hypothetical protein C8034_v007437 [Colletotrichum sidae]|uniref:Uncharacterized protein n=2 Tax=Colletotrichum orbiculare species complex TaxID=2707354 RepID=N4UKP9_COLOR|nr:hypothetical protein Cob_v007249 [Colletotrichum orbiculare MAFF 240422]TEA11462.1 hypothetical protein C8034_v007437 [Colletotrichum sidae]